MVSISDKIDFPSVGISIAIQYDYHYLRSHSSVLISGEIGLSFLFILSTSSAY